MAEALETTVLDDRKEEAVIKQPPSVLEDEDEKFEEMSQQKVVSFSDDEDEEEEEFKIKEDLIDVDTTAKMMTKSVDLLGNDIVKSIEKANLIYDNNAEDLGALFQSNSEDDLEFKPVTNGKNKNRKKKKMAGESICSSSCSDTEKPPNGNEGWSFEADDLDVNTLLQQQQPLEAEEEKAALEDVFKFDSELKDKEDKKIQLNMSASLTNDESEETSNDSALSQSMTYQSTTTSNSESSVGNSPNPRATSKKKGKSKKKKR